MLMFYGEILEKADATSAFRAGFELTEIARKEQGGKN